MGRISGEPPKNLDHITELSSVLFSFKKNSVELEKKIFKLFGTAVRRLHPNCARVERVCYPRFLSDDVWSDVIALCWRAEFLWIVILSRLCPSRFRRALFIPLWLKPTALWELLFVGSVGCF